MMSAMFTHLVWKDAAMVKKLLLIVVVAIVVVNFAIVISSLTDPFHANDSFGFAVVVWSLLPNLVAFGIPALLIGTEEESGTLAWLRTLPVPRRNLIYSKLLVAATAVVIVWALSSIALLIVTVLIPNLGNIDPKQGWFSIVGASIFFSMLLLLIGFVTSYAFRSPIAALLSVLPIVVVCFLVFALLVNEFDSPGSTAIVWVLPLILGGFLFFLIGLQHHLALRRLRPAQLATNDAKSSFSLADTIHFAAEQTETDYSVSLQLRLPIPRMVRAATKQNLLARPTPTKALLWQAASQQAAPALGLTVLALAASYVASVGRRNPFVELTSMIIVLSLCWLGSLTFYSDTLRRRHFFFADRGISRTRVWLTRMALPSGAMLLFAIASASMYGRFWDDRSEYAVIVIGLVGFAVGSLSSLLATRPVLGQIVSPVLLAVISAGLFGFVLIDFESYWPAMLLAAIPMLFATWRLLPRWSRAQRGIGFDGRVVGYVLLGMLSVFIYIHAHRLATVPAALPEWRAARLAEPITTASTYTGSTTDYFEAQQTFSALPAITHMDVATRVCTESLVQSRKAREAIIRGELSPSFLTRLEHDEAKILSRCRSLRIGTTDPQLLTKVLDQLASDSLRRDSRRAALVSEWRGYQSQDWQNPQLLGRTYSPKKLFGKAVAPRHANSWIERWRADRFVDAATNATLKYVDKGQSQPSRDESRELRSLWKNVYDMRSNADDQNLPISLEADKLIAELRLSP